VPFEFPLFQAAASAVMDFGVADDRAMRVTGLACFLLTALLLFGLVRHVAGRVSAFAALAAFVFTPFALVWGRASLMEYLATAGAVGFTSEVVPCRTPARSRRGS
jgi:4-amino-4-deoxy-L-arabinose transferase-like glycosyltransferase